MSTRSNRHVVIEGPDGAGKSTLVKYLAPILDVPVARRISDSIKGVQGKNLARYVDGDMGQWTNNASADESLHDVAFHQLPTPSRIYDRYPLISEPIYGLHVRKGMQPEFGTQWYRDKWAKFLAYDPLVIWCLPPYDEVAKHVHPSRDMDGVWRNISQLYQAYRIEALKFPGRSFIYNHTIHKPGQVVDLASRHFEI
jgi:energy-coupling factor transporter ATP-binding protein EcfA2